MSGIVKMTIITTLVAVTVAIVFPEWRKQALASLMLPVI